MKAMISSSPLMSVGILSFFGLMVYGLCAWDLPKAPDNTNVWTISIGNQRVLSSHQNQMGDKVGVYLKSIRPTDTLYVSRYLCGHTANNALSVLTIQNCSQKTLLQVSSRNSGLSFESKVPVKDLLEKFQSGQTMRLYFTILSKEEHLTESVLLGKIHLN